MDETLEVVGRKKGLHVEIVEYEAKELEECIWRVFAQIRKSENFFHLTISHCLRNPQQL